MSADVQCLELVADTTEFALDAADVRLEWLPSMPITRKRQVPPVAGIGFFFSEGDSQVYHLFETPNLRDTLSRYSRHQAAALGKDPDSRIGWLALDPHMDRSRLLKQLRELHIS